MTKKICWAKKLYSQTTPYVQLGGWLVVAVPALYTAFAFYSQVQASVGEILEAKKSIVELQQWRQQDARDMAIVKEGVETLKRQSQQIYSVLIQRK